MTRRFISLLAFLALHLARPSSAEESDADIATKLNNPVSNLISVPFQMNWDFGMGPTNQGSQFKLNFQPVIPVNLNEHWELIIRTIVPYISQEDVLKQRRLSYPGLPEDLLASFPGEVRTEIDRAARKAFDRGVRKRPVDHHQNGVGDILQSFFFKPSAGGPFGTTLALGPAFSYPSATDDLLGSEKWCVGPTLLVLKQEHGWTYGVLSNHLWSFAGNNDRRNVNATFVQPFLNYQFPTHTTVGVNAEATYDWNTRQWTVPVNFSVNQLIRVGKVPVQLSFGARYYAEGPSGAPDWGLRFTVTLVLPEGNRSSTHNEGKGSLQ